MMEDNKFNQLCVMEGITLGDSTIEEFEKTFEEQGFRVKFAEEVETNEKYDDGSNRTDLFFYIHDEDISKFAIPRLQMGIRWWEDVLGNGHKNNYTKETLDKYKPKWNEENINDEDEFEDYKNCDIGYLIELLQDYARDIPYDDRDKYNAILDGLYQQVRWK